ncbi:MAG: endo-1,4-beta-xylanase, partial [Novosphingobium meiothermophilum]
NPNYAAMLERDCGVLVAENELKWEFIRPGATTYNFTRFDEMLAYAESKSMLMRGHTLLWYVEERFPGWARGYSASATPNVTDLVRGHIETVIRRYGNRIYSWDVVNEAIDPATGQLRSNSFSRLAGEDTSLIDLAFRTARAEAPNAQLVYNDYMDWGGGDAPRHREGVLNLLRGFRDRNVPVDALGIQGHIGFYSSQPARDIVDARRDSWVAFLNEVVALGYDLVLTELDVNDVGRNGSTAVRDEDSATLVRGYLDILLSYRQCRDVLVWGMSDRYSWLQSFAPRSDGQPQRPCPYDRDFQVKPMRQAIIDAIAAAPALAAPA